MAGRTYRFYQREPLYPFGHGLSYTSFAYSDLHLSDPTLAPGETLTVGVTVQNVGERAGDEVVQLYVSHASPLPGNINRAPLRQLQGLQRLHLAAGETRAVHFTLSARQFAIFNDVGNPVHAPGSVQIAVGGRQPLAKAAAEDVQDVLTVSVSLVAE
jgi:beta-glucosidase